MRGGAESFPRGFSAAVFREEFSDGDFSAGDFPTENFPTGFFSGGFPRRFLMGGAAKMGGIFRRDLL